MPSRRIYEKVSSLLSVGRPVSGPRLGEELGVSRAAVWRAVGQLRERGARISTSKEGYVLEEPADLLDPDWLASSLRGCGLGRSIVYADKVASTQSVAHDLVQRPFDDGTVVVAERQTRGLGRSGRHWASDRGGLWFTVALRPKASPDCLQAYSYLASLSVRDSISNILPGEPWLKWPNDVFIGEAKVCGILTEVAASREEIKYVLLGVGINANNDVKSLVGDYPAASLRSETGTSVDRNELLSSILRRMGERYSKAERCGFDEIIADYRARCATLGKRVRVVCSESVLEGVAEGIDERGALEVRCGGRLLKVHSGDVIHLRQV